MKEKVISITIIIVMILGSFGVAGAHFKVESDSGNSIENTYEFHGKTEEEILREIEETKDKYLEVEDVIGEVNVKYWEHEINEVQIKNDYILLHRDIYTNQIVEYIREWRDTDEESFHFEYTDFEPEGIFWMEKVIFLDITDTGHFYDLDEDQIFPVACWEVRHIDGTTIVYNVKEDMIGHGIPAPETGYALSGYDEQYGNPWNDFKDNAFYWFSKWGIYTAGSPTPSPEKISGHVKDSDLRYFYELAHGGPDRFQADASGSYYYASNSDGYNVRDDMKNKGPITFAFIGSCEGMTKTGYGTFSYEFRKGKMTNTVTVGYDHMESCPGWEYALEWQDHMFKRMDRGWTIKRSFDSATAYYPSIESGVAFKGDTNLEPFNSPRSKSQQSVSPFLQRSFEKLIKQLESFPILQPMIQRSSKNINVVKTPNTLLAWNKLMVPLTRLIESVKPVQILAMMD